MSILCTNFLDCFLVILYTLGISHIQLYSFLFSCPASPSLSLFLFSRFNFFLPRISLFAFLPRDSFLYKLFHIPRSGVVFSFLLISFSFLILTTLPFSFNLFLFFSPFSKIIFRYVSLHDSLYQSFIFIRSAVFLFRPCSLPSCLFLFFTFISSFLHLRLLILFFVLTFFSFITLVPSLLAFLVPIL